MMNIIELAKEAGFFSMLDRNAFEMVMSGEKTAIEKLERFAALVRAEYEAPLLMAEEALETLSFEDERGFFTAYDAETDVTDLVNPAIAAIREALAEPIDAKAIRAEALEEAAKVCDAIANAEWDAYKGRTEPIDRSKLYNAHTEGISDGADECAAAIRRLK